MKQLDLKIVRCVDDEHFPGWLECEFVDIEGRSHSVIDKVPMFSLDPLDKNSCYPQPGLLYCEILKTWRDPLRRELVRITIDRPYHVESTEGLSEFVVLATQISEVSAQKQNNRRHRALNCFLEPFDNIRSSVTETLDLET